MNQEPDYLKDWLAPKIRKLLRNDWDCWNLFSGFEGSGKSTESIWLAHFVSGQRFSIKEHIVYDSEDLLTAIYNAPKGCTIDLDEGGAAWYNLNYATKINKAIDQAAMEIRERNLMVNLCVPRWHYLGKVAIYRHRYWFNVYPVKEQRGFSRISAPQWDPYSKTEIPYWQALFRQRFPPLPKKILDVYRPMKKMKGEERLAKYIDVIANEKERMCPEKRLTAQEIARKITSEGRERFHNTRGRVDWRKVMFIFECSEPIARQVSASFS